MANRLEQPEVDLGRFSKFNQRGAHKKMVPTCHRMMDSGKTLV